MTTLIYNGVQLRNCETKVFDQKIQYDESRTDAIYSTFRIKVSSVMIAYADYTDQDHRSTVEPNGLNATGGTLPERCRRIHAMLSQPGKLLYYFISNAHSSGAAIAPSALHSDMLLVAIGPAAAMPDGTPNGSDIEGLQILKHPYRPELGTFDASEVVDHENGPKPIDVSVTPIIGGKSMQVTFEVEVCRAICDSIDTSDPYPPTEPNIPGQPDDPETPEDETEAAHQIKPSTKVLSNRWFITESKGADWKTTRTMQGTLRVRDKRWLPHLTRYLVVPPLMEGYQRVTQNFANDPTDLVLKYRIEDKQQHEAPPSPAIDWKGHYVEMGSKLGVMQIGELSIRLVGPPGIDKQLLIGAAGRVLNARMKGLQKDPASEDTEHSVKLLESSVYESIENPIVQLTARVQYAGSDVKYLRLRLKQIGTPLNLPDVGDGEPPNSIDDYSPTRWPVPLPFDSASPSGIFSCYLQNPCSKWHGVIDAPEDALTPYRADGDESTDQRSGYTPRTPIDFDRDVRTYPSATDFPEEDKTVVADEQYAGFPYTFVKIRSQYITETGVAQLPLAQVSSSGPTCSLIRLHGGLTKRDFRMEVVRDGKLPLVPEPLQQIVDPNGVEEQLLNQDIAVFDPEISADGVTRTYRVIAHFVYGLSRPPKPSEKLRMAISPIDASAGELRYINQTDLL